MIKKARPAKVDKEVYKELQKYCIEEDIKISKALEMAINDFLERK